MITACIVNYNGEQCIEETLKSVLLEQDYLGEILLIDNSSNDRTLQIVKTKFPQVRIIQLTANFGPAVARNAGFLQAAGEWVLFLDNDVCLTAGCVKELAKALHASPQAIAVMPRVVYAQDDTLIQYDGADTHYLGLMMLHNQNLRIGSAGNRIKKLGSLVSACFLMDSKKWSNGTPFDESFFIYFEDNDFALNARLKGYEILSVPSAIVRHGQGTTGVSLRKEGSYSRLRVSQLIRNRWQIILKYYSAKTLLSLIPVFLVYECFQLAAVLKKGWGREWLESVLWIFCNFGSIRQKRHNIQRFRKIADRELFKGGPIPFTSHLISSPIDRIGKNVLDSFVKIYYYRILKYL